MFTVSRRLGKVTGAQIVKRYGTRSVSYSNGEPDFIPFADRRIGVIPVDVMPLHRQGKGGSYALAEAHACARMGCTLAQLRSYMTLNGLTWHECGDRHTILAIPTAINSAFTHSGGISMEKALYSLSRSMHRRFPNGFAVYRNKKIYRIFK